MTTPVYLPPVRSVGLAQPLTWLARGLNDLTHAGWVSWAHGLAAALFGLGVSVLAYRHFWLLAGVLSAFLVVGPVLATSFYALSRALERQQRADWGVVRRTWLGWQRSHPRAWREHDYWCLVEFGLLLALGRMCARQRLWGKAQSYLEASLGLAQSQAAHLELARLLEQLGQTDAANQHYRAAVAAHNTH